jgi:hypothetical protein
MAFVEDLAPFLADFGGLCSLEGVQVPAILDTQTLDAVGDVLTNEPSALMATVAVPAAAAGQTFIAQGVTYTVRAVRAEPPDGALTRLVLVRA